MLDRPDADEYFEFYHRYVEAVPDGDLLDTLQHQSGRVVEAFSQVPQARETFAYGPGKWTIREMLGHMIDAERVFTYRGLTIARGDQSALPGFEENEWAERSNAGSRDLSSLIAEFESVRAATVSLYRSLDPPMDRLSGTASGKSVTVRAIAWITAGHAEHHLGLLADRYVAAFGDA